MQFDSISFLVFFVALLFFYNIPSSWGIKKNQLLVGSYLFYAAWNPWFLPLLLFSTTMDWLLALAIDRSKTLYKKKIFLTITIVVNLSILAFFKYVLFLMQALHDFLCILLKLI